MFVFIVGVLAVAMTAQHAAKKADKAKKVYEEKEKSLTEEIRKLQEHLAVRVGNSRFLVQYAKSLSTHLRETKMARKLSIAQSTQYLALATSRRARVLAAEERIAVLQSQLLDVSSSNQSKDRQLQELRSKYDEIESLVEELTARNEDINHLHTEIDRRGAVIAAAEKETREGSNRAAALDKDIQMKNETINRMMQEMEEKSKTANRRAQERLESDMVIQGLMNQMRAKDAEIAALNERLENASRSDGAGSSTHGPLNQNLPDPRTLMADLSVASNRISELEDWNYQMSEELRYANQGGWGRQDGRGRRGGNRNSFGQGGARRTGGWGYQQQ